MASAHPQAGPSTLTQASGALLLASAVGLVLLGSESGASWPTYVLAVLALVRLPALLPALRAPEALAAFGLMGLFVVSVAWSPEPSADEAKSAIVRLVLQGCLLLAIAEQVVRGAGLRMLVTLFVPATAIAALAAMWSWWGSPEQAAGVRLHGLGAIENPNVLGLVCGSAMVLATHGLVAPDTARPLRGLFWACLPVLLLCVALTESRNAWFCTGVGIIAAITLQARTEPGRTGVRTQILVGLVAGATLAAALGIESVRDFLFPRGASLRPDIWRGALDRVLDGHLLVGLGIGAEHTGEIDGEPYQHTHNLFLAALFHTGLVGVVLLVVTAVAATRTLVAHLDDPRARLGLALLCTAGSAALVDQFPLLDKIGPGWLLLWLPVGVAMGLHWRHGRGGAAQ